MQDQDSGRLVTVAVSGGFDPLHYGHVKLFEECKKLGDYLTVILNNDNWLYAKKGYVFMPVMQRRYILLNLRMVDDVIITAHTHNPADMTVARELAALRPNLFCNGGDRTEGNVPTDEHAVCKKHNIRMLFNLVPQLESSSRLVRQVLMNYPKAMEAQCAKP